MMFKRDANRTGIGGPRRTRYCADCSYKVLSRDEKCQQYETGSLGRSELTFEVGYRADLTPTGAGGFWQKAAIRRAHKSTSGA